MNLQNNRDSAGIKGNNKFVWHLDRYEPSPLSTKELPGLVYKYVCWMEADALGNLRLPIVTFKLSFSKLVHFFSRRRNFLRFWLFCTQVVITQRRRRHWLTSLLLKRRLWKRHVMLSIMADDSAVCGGVTSLLRRKLNRYENGFNERPPHIFNETKKATLKAPQVLKPMMVLSLT